MCVYPKGAGQLEVQCPVKAVRAVPLELWKTVNKRSHLFTYKGKKFPKTN